MNFMTFHSVPIQLGMSSSQLTKSMIFRLEIQVHQQSPSHPRWSEQRSRGPRVAGQERSLAGPQWALKKGDSYGRIGVIPKHSSKWWLQRMMNWYNSCFFLWIIQWWFTIVVNGGNCDELGLFVFPVKCGAKELFLEFSNYLSWDPRDPTSYLWDRSPVVTKATQNLMILGLVIYLTGGSWGSEEEKKSWPPSIQFHSYFSHPPGSPCYDPVNLWIVEVIENITLWLCQNSYWKWPIYSRLSH